MKIHEIMMFDEIKLKDDELLVIVGGNNLNEQVPYNCGLGCGSGCGHGCGSCSHTPTRPTTTPDTILA